MERQEFGGFGIVSGGPFEGIRDELFLGFTHGPMKARAARALSRSGFQHSLGQVLRKYDIRAAQHDRVFDGVLELPNVPGPLILEEAGARFRRYARDLTSAFAAAFRAEVTRQQRDILPALPERRQRHGKHVEPVVKILSESSL